MKNILPTIILLMTGLSSGMAGETAHDFAVQDIAGQAVALSDYKGKVLLVVNVASRCGYTPQYEGLQRLHEQFAEKGLVVMGFPANNFGGQEPGTNEEILEFCASRYSVSFPMFAKISVNGEDQAPLFQYLTAAENPDFSGPVSWNFEKILVGPDGTVLRRFRSGAEPDGAEVIAAVEVALSGS